MLHVWRRVALDALRRRQALRKSTMKRLLKALAIAGVAVLGFAANGKAQVQQSISFSLTLYDQTDTGVRALHVTTRDVIVNLAGNNITRRKFWLGLPGDTPPRQKR